MIREVDSKFRTGVRRILAKLDDRLPAEGPIAADLDALMKMMPQIDDDELRGYLIGHLEQGAATWAGVLKAVKKL